MNLKIPFLTKDTSVDRNFSAIQNWARIVHNSASSYPTTGFHKQGEVVYDSSPSAGGYMGWVCTDSGTPGTWKTFGQISS